MHTTETIKKQIAELEEQRKNISKEIRHLKKIIYQRESYKPSKNKNSLVWRTFGKSVKNLTPTERKKYDAIRQAKTRNKTKEE
jgi:hypothetical protein